MHLFEPIIVDLTTRYAHSSARWSRHVAHISHGRHRAHLLKPDARVDVAHIHLSKLLGLLRHRGVTHALLAHAGLTECLLLIHSCLAHVCHVCRTHAWLTDGLAHILAHVLLVQVRLIHGRAHAHVCDWCPLSRRLGLSAILR